MNRRTFNRIASISAVGGSTLPLNFSRIFGANDRINIGVIGANGMGWSNVRSLLNLPSTECLGIADVDDSVFTKRKLEYAFSRSNEMKTYKDYRKLLDDKDIDVVVIGSPDHWHCKMFVDALEAGKHVYVEKPIANTIEECYIMMKAAEKYKKQVQVGQWQRSGPHYREAIDIVQSGTLGKIRLVKVWAYQGWMKPVPVVPDSDPPDGVDYKSWLGPAPIRPFNKNRFHFNFRWFWDYAGGLMTDWGVHEIDIALFAMKAEAPISVMASGGKFAYPDDASETPDTLQAVFQYEDFNMLWEHATGIDLGPYGRREGIAFIGNNGTLVVNRDGYEVMAERASQGYSSEGETLTEPISLVPRPEGVSYLNLHTENFIEAIRSNDPSILNTPISSGSVAAINAQMGNISYKLGRKVFWDTGSNSFKDDTDANGLMKAHYHNGISLPQI